MRRYPKPGRARQRAASWRDAARLSGETRNLEAPVLAAEAVSHQATRLTRLATVCAQRALASG